MFSDYRGSSVFAWDDSKAQKTYKEKYGTQSLIKLRSIV